MLKNTKETVRLGFYVTDTPDRKISVRRKEVTEDATLLLRLADAEAKVAKAGCEESHPRMDTVTMATAAMDTENTTLDTDTTADTRF